MKLNISIMPSSLMRSVKPMERAIRISVNMAHDHIYRYAYRPFHRLNRTHQARRHDGYVQLHQPVQCCRRELALYRSGKADSLLRPAPVPIRSQAELVVNCWIPIEPRAV